MSDNVTISVPCAYHPKKTTTWQFKEINGVEYLVVDTTFTVPLDWSPDDPNVFVVCGAIQEGVDSLPVVFEAGDSPLVLHDEGYKSSED